MRDKECVDPNERGGREEIGVVGGGKFLNRLYCLKKCQFSIKNI